MTILLIGGSGYVGQAFRAELERREWDFLNVSRAQVDYTRFKSLLNLLRDTKPSFLINCAGFTGKPNVDACEVAKSDTIRYNAVLSETIANACEVASIPWGQVSSGCIYSGAKIRQPDAEPRIEKNLMAPQVRPIWQANADAIQGFTETDEPNFTFESLPCSFYSGIKAVGETILSQHANVYQWRLRIPFDQFNNPRNYLTKLQRYAKLYNNVNSLSHRGDFAKACLDLWECRADFGIYNATNPGWVTTEQVAEMLKERLGLARQYEYFLDDEDFYRFASAPRSSTVLDTRKILATGVKIRPVEDALDEAIRHWQE